MKPIAHITEEDLFDCPVMLAIKLHDGRVIWTTGRFRRGDIEIHTPEPDQYDTFGVGYRQPYFYYEREPKTRIDIELRTDQVGWRDGTPEWAEDQKLLPETTNGSEKQTGPMELDVHRRTLPLQAGGDVRGSSED